MERHERILERCGGLGFALAGICGVEASRYAQEFRAWLRSGKHGTMAYLEEHAEARIDPARWVLEGAKSAIVVADVYAVRGDVARGGVGLEEGGRVQGGGVGAGVHGRIARYARGGDYHTVIKKRLHALCDALAAEHPGERFRACVDTAPVMERELAQRAGLGWIGKHTLLIHPRLGSFTLLGVVLTTLDLVEGESDARSQVPDHCGTCTRCIDACPTHAITPYSVDASRCISSLTIEHRGDVPMPLAEGVGEWILGCDVCQEVCPHNSPRGPGFESGVRNDRPHPAYVPRRVGLHVLDVLAWTAEDRARELAGSAMKRATLEMFKRNAAIVAMNAIKSGCPEPHRSALRTRLGEVAADETESALVRRTCLSCLERIGE